MTLGLPPGGRKLRFHRPETESPHAKLSTVPTGYLQHLVESIEQHLSDQLLNYLAAELTQLLETSGVIIRQLVVIESQQS